MTAGCAAREVKTEACAQRFKPTRLSLHVYFLPGLSHSLRLAHLCASQYPFHVNLSAHGAVPIGDHQVLDSAHSSISRYNLSGSTARCHANYNKSGTSAYASSSHGCVTPACVRHCTRFIFSSLSSSAMFILSHYLNCISTGINVGMLSAKFGVDEMFRC